MGLGGLKPSYFKTSSGIKSMLAPKSHRALAHLDVLIVQGIVDALGSPYFCAIDQDIISL